MTRAVARAHFTSAPLIRQFADQKLIDAGAPRPDFADRLGQWLGFSDAMALFAAHGNSEHTAPAIATPNADTAYSPEGDCALTRRALTDAITLSLVPGQHRARLRLPDPPLDTSDAAIAHEDYRRFHLAHQREMEQSIRALRARLRTALTMASPALAQLAQIDAVFDNALSERESRLLATIPRLLQQRFAQHLAEHQASSVQANVPDDAASPMPDASTPTWLAAYIGDMQSILLAELDLRLQPALGLAEAFSHQKACLQ